MKRTERHRLKENEVALSVARAQETFATYQKPIVGAAVAVAVLIVALVVFFVWRQGVDRKSRAMLAQAMSVEQAQIRTPPAPGENTPAAPSGSTFLDEKSRAEAALKAYMGAAEAYPSTAAGIAARYHAASLTAQLGRTADAIKLYQAVESAAGTSLYGEMAKLGIADAEAAGGQYDKAIAAYRELMGAKDQKLPVEGILMQLARAYQEKGSTAEARNALRRIVEEFPESPYAASAKREMDGLKG